jgi:hypothetical protein
MEEMAALTEEKGDTDGGLRRTPLSPVFAYLHVERCYSDGLGLSERRMSVRVMGMLKNYGNMKSI